MITFDRLKLELKDRIPQESGIPSEGQYDAAIRSGVARLNTDAGMIKPGTLSVVSGTASYDLGSDFLKMIHLDSTLQGSTYVTPGGPLIPVSAAATTEQITIYGTTLTIKPTPGYTLDREYIYKAAHVLNASGEYPDMGEEEAYLILLVAQQELMRRSLTSTADKALKYSFGDVSVDTGGKTTSIAAAVKALEEAYKERLKSYRGPMAVRADYDLVDHANYTDRLIV